MAPRGSQLSVVLAILRKDLLEFSRERLYPILSIAGLAAFIAVYWLIPDSVDETVAVGVYLDDRGELAELFLQADDDEGLDPVIFDRQADLRAVIAGRAELWRGVDGETIIRDLTAGDSRPGGAERVDLVAGIELPPGFFLDVATGVESTVTLLVNDDTPAEIRGALGSLVREIAYMIAGVELPVTEPDAGEIVLGTDRLGMHVSMRERLKPMLAFFVLMTETFVLASLIASEIANRTVTAIIATPAKLRHLLIAKSIHGIALSFFQAVVLLAAIGSFTTSNWYLLLIAALFGATMFTGVAMIAGAAGRDFIGTLFGSMLWILPLAIPAFAALIPGSTAPWVRVVPSYGIMRVLIDVTSYGAGFSDVAGALGLAALWLVALFGLGLFVLARRVARL